MKRSVTGQNDDKRESMLNRRKKFDYAHLPRRGGRGNPRFSLEDKLLQVKEPEEDISVIVRSRCVSKLNLSRTDVQTLQSQVAGTCVSRCKIIINLFQSDIRSALHFREKETISVVSCVSCTVPCFPSRNGSLICNRNENRHCNFHLKPQFLQSLRHLSWPAFNLH